MASNTLLRLQGDPNRPVKTRHSHRKVRTGCTICKQRKIKCDEGKPSCQKCLKLRWKCVYQRLEKRPLTVDPKRPLAPKATDSEIYSRQFSILKPPGGSRFHSEQEYRSFQTFCEKTAFALAGFEEPDVWNCLVLQACESQESIRNLVIALGALDKTLEAFQIKQQQPSFDLKPLNGYVTSYHQFALQRYGKAVKRMREELSGGKQDLRTTLISCLLIVAFELFHGNHTSALAQGSIGLKLILDQIKKSRERNKHKNLSTESLFNSIEEALIQKFVRLDLSSMAFADETVIRTYDTSESETFDHLEVIPPIFTSFAEAQKYWELSMRRIMNFMALAKSWKDKPPFEQPQIPTVSKHIHIDDECGKIAESFPVAAKMQEKDITNAKSATSEASMDMNPHMRRALAWEAAFQPLFQYSRTPEGRKDFVRATLLQIRLKTTIIAASTTPLESELQFDKLTPIYEEILSLAESISTTHLSSSKASFTFDVGPIGPLFVVATRCRDCAMRRRAIKLLLANPRRECFWDNIVAAKFVMAVMMIEEMELKDGFVPESARLRIEGIEFDLLESKGRLRYSRGMWKPLEERLIESIEVSW